MDYIRSYNIKVMIFLIVIGTEKAPLAESWEKITPILHLHPAIHKAVQP